MTRVQIKNRPKFNAEKNAEDLENAIELFTVSRKRNKDQDSDDIEKMGYHF